MKITYFELLKTIKEGKPIKSVGFAGEEYHYDSYEQDYVNVIDDRMYLSTEIMAHVVNLNDIVTDKCITDLSQCDMITYLNLIFRVRNHIAPQKIKVSYCIFVWDERNQQYFLSDDVNKTKKMTVARVLSAVFNATESDLANKPLIKILED